MRATMNIREAISRTVGNGRSLLMVLGAFLASAVPEAAHAASCGPLARVAMQGVKITTAEQVAAGQFRAPQDSLTRIMTQPGMNPAGRAQSAGNPAFCRVAATLKPTSDSEIRIEVWLPLKGWNGKFLAIGNFGWAGSLMYPGMQSGLTEGYAVASTDTGHDSATPDGEGGRFALGHPEKLIDYAYRADHLMTVDAKAIIKAFYGRRPAYSYWIGCSLGGLEGLIEAKRYPSDYDGIVAGAPPNPIVNFNAEQLWAGWFSNRNPQLQVPRAKFAMAAKFVLKTCATAVGRAQGFVDEPDQCRFEPRQLLCKGADRADCLTANQVKALELIYRGPVNPRTGQVIFPGPAKGNEASFSADGKPFPIALDLFRYAAFQDLTWEWTTLDWDKDIARATAAVGPLLHVDSDLKPFFAQGGKLLMYIGWNDGHNPQELINYYRRLMNHAGPLGRASARLFTIPGMGHCYGGPGCDTFNKLGVIDGWVASHRAPDRIVASKVSSGRVVRTRPLCAWPALARYRGEGSPNRAGSFACAKRQ
jgi:feruloyl esterase